MEKQIFRKKSVERVSSPEQLNDYIRVSNPSVWMTLAAIIVLLAGVCVWGVLGRLETKVNVAALAEGGSIVCYVKETDVAEIGSGMAVRIGENEFTVKNVSASPVTVGQGGQFSEYLLHVGGLQVGEWVYEVVLDGNLADGVYAAEIVVDSVSPMSFVFN